MVFCKEVNSRLEEFELVVFAAREIGERVENSVPAPEIIAELQIFENHLGSCGSHRVKQNSRGSYHMEHVYQSGTACFVVIGFVCVTEYL